MDALNIAGFIVGLVGTVVGIAVAVRARQLSRPVLSITIGHPSIDKALPRAVRRTPGSTLIFGAPQSALPNVIAVPFFLENRSGIPITDLSLRVEYTLRHLLTDGACISDPAIAPHITVQMNEAAKREVMTVVDKAYVSFDVGILRPHDTTVLWEFLAVGPPLESTTSAHEDGDPRVARATRRFGAVRGFRRFMILDVVARSSNCYPFATSVNIIWSAVDSPQALDHLGEECAASAWDGAKPAPGLYFDPLRIFRPRHLRRFVREELVSLLFLNSGVNRYASSPKEIADRTMLAHFTAGVLYAPPWGLTGAAFDVQKALGARVLRARRTSSKDQGAQ